MSVLWKQFLPYILPDVPGCPRHLAENAARDAGLEFGRESNYWTGTLAPINVVAGQSDYQLVAPTDAYITSPTQVQFYDGNETTTINPTTFDMLASSSTDWRNENSLVPSYYWMRDPMILSLYPTPNTAYTGALRVDVNLTSSRSSLTAPDTLYECWAEAVGYGAKYRLMMIANKTWSNMEAASIQKKLFDSMCAKARGHSIKSLSGISMGAKAQSFGGVRDTV